MTSLFLVCFLWFHCLSQWQWRSPWHGNVQEERSQYHKMLCCLFTAKCSQRRKAEAPSHMGCAGKWCPWGWAALCGVSQMPTEAHLCCEMWGREGHRGECSPHLPMQTGFFFSFIKGQLSYFFPSNINLHVML